MALPGGVILVCDELLGILGSESELVAVLAHEVGHVELGHTFDTVRFELLARRTGSATLGELADATVRLLLQNTYSQAAEHEADDYAFQLLAASSYDPAALGRSFASLQRATDGEDGGREPSDPLADSMRSHPPTPLRQMEYAQRAGAWWRARPKERRYVGRSNLLSRNPLAAMDLPREWVTGASAGSPAHQPMR